MCAPRTLDIRVISGLTHSGLWTYVYTQDLGPMCAPRTLDIRVILGLTVGTSMDTYSDSSHHLTQMSNRGNLKH